MALCPSVMLHEPANEFQHAPEHMRLKIFLLAVTPSDPFDIL